MIDEYKTRDELVQELLRLRGRVAELQVSEAELKQTERQRVEGERLQALGEMSAGVSNSLNNILTGILGPAELLKDQINDAEVLRVVDTIYDAAIRGRELVKRLNRTSSEKSTDPLVPVPVRAMVEEILQLVCSRLEAHGGAIDVVLELEDVPSVEGTQAGLYDILTHLMFNAVDALPDGGTITVGLHPDGNGVQLVLRDTGVGMDEETQRRVFEPFFSTKTEREAVTGLGLSAVHGIVTQWGGTIQVTSAPGEGSSFEVWLPAWQDPKIEMEKGIEVQEVRRARVLAVDDEQSVRALLTYLLGRDHDLEVLQDGRDALKQFEPGVYDVALVDLEMPGLTGDEVAKQMRAVDPSLVIVLITGYLLKEDDQRLPPFDFYIQKPFVPLNKIRNVMARAVELHDTRVGEK
ncbi:MAG: ATP-binding protein [bacterium]|nr:ATP-binding protein [bacterium]